MKLCNADSLVRGLRGKGIFSITENELEQWNDEYEELEAQVRAERGHKLGKFGTTVSDNLREDA